MSNRSNPQASHIGITPSASPITIGNAANRVTGIYVGGSGDITATIRDVTETYFNVQAGSILPGEFTHVTAASASGLIALGD